MNSQTLKFRVSIWQMIADIFGSLFLCIVGYFVIMAFLFALFGALLSTLNINFAAGILPAVPAATLIMVVLMVRMDWTWWWISLAPQSLTLKSLGTRYIAYQNIVLIHGGLEVGIQNDGERKKVLSLTIEEVNGHKSKIRLKTEDAQTCIKYVTDASPSTGGINTNGEAILPREQSAVAEVKHRIGHKYLLSAMAGLGVGIPCQLLFLYNIGSLFSQGQNPFAVVVALIAVVSIQAYGFWALGKYREMTKKADAK